MNNKTNLIPASSGSNPIISEISSLSYLEGDALEAVITLFLQEQQVMPSSRRTYGWTLRRFFKWCRESNLRTSQLQRSHVVAYVDALARKGFSAKSIASYTVAVRRFFGWLDSKGQYPNIASGVKGPRKMKEGFVKMHLDIDERRRLLDAAKDRGERDYAIVNLMLRNGLRTIEVSRIDVCDITTRKGVRNLNVWRKGALGKASYVVLTEESYGPIADYLDTREAVLPGSPLFVTDGDGHRDGRMTPRRIQQIVKEYVSGGSDSPRGSILRTACATRQLWPYWRQAEAYSTCRLFWDTPLLRPHRYIQGARKWRDGFGILRRT